MIPILPILSLLFIKSKIQFSESKSQLVVLFRDTYFGCLSSQRYNFLKANHNCREILWYWNQVVYQVKDTIFWKQITTSRIITTAKRGCLSSQRYNFLKANHNQLFHSAFYSLLFIKSKIQFSESKSQLYHNSVELLHRCLSSQRYNFLKANHNLLLPWLNVYLLFIKSKIQFSESKS